MLEKIFEKTTFKDILPIIIASVAIVGFWRGIWGLMDIYLFPNNNLYSNLTSVIIGLIIIIGISVYRRRK